MEGRRRCTIHVWCRQTVEDDGPKGRALVFDQPHAEILASAVAAHADGQMYGHVPDAGAVADLDVHCIEEGNGVDVL